MDSQTLSAYPDAAPTPEPDLSAPFAYHGPAWLLLALFGSEFADQQLELLRRNVPARLLLNADAPLPAIPSWTIRYQASRAQDHGQLLQGGRHYRLEPGAQGIEIDASAIDAETQAAFERAWHAAEGSTPRFPYLKAALPQAEADAHLRNPWPVSRATLDAIRTEALPTFLLNLAQLEHNYRRFCAALPHYPVYYSIKSNPHPELLATLYALGAGFEAVSYAEIQLALEAGASPERVIFSAPIKRREDLRRTRDLDLYAYVADCREEIDKLAEELPGARLLLRLRGDDVGARVALSSKYGADHTQVLALLHHAKARGLQPLGLTFQAGGQNESATAWAQMQRRSHALFDAARAEGLDLTLLNIGGGFPIHLHTEVPEIEAIGQALEAERRDDIRYCAEPGRILVADCGLLATPIAARAERSDGDWLYIDATLFGALFMVGAHQFDYPISADPPALDRQPYQIASLSCDGKDIICRNRLLPVGLGEGDLLLFHLVGAYSLPVFDVAYAGVSPTRVKVIAC